MRKQQNAVEIESQATSEKIISEKEQEWQDGFEKMAKDPDLMDVGYAIDAQAEVVLRDRT